MINKIGNIFGIIVSIIGIVMGILVIIYRKKFLKLNKDRLSKQKDILHQKMLESMENRSNQQSYILIIFVGAMIAIVGIFQLINIFKLW
jgi:UDP-N-acetylmuramyl pentapeptide phosphotransferase/UDP-N-acetylglucosamine-1-phosphate transferase